MKAVRNPLLRSFAAALLFTLASSAQPPDGKPARPLRERLLERALQGDRDAQFDLGKNYETGRIGLKKDFGEAEYWYRKAAEQGEPFAQASLGILYGFGKGVPQDLVQAYMWYELSVEGTTGGDRVSVVEMRDDLASKLTPQQLDEARRLAKEWKPEAKRKEEVLAAMNAFKDALIAKDGAALDKLLTPDLAYVHSGGELQSKKELIDSIVQAKSVIQKLEFSGTTVRFYANTALVRGHVDLYHSPENIVRMDVLHVWVHSLQGWRLASRQATRLPK